MVAKIEKHEEYRARVVFFGILRFILNFPRLEHLILFPQTSFQTDAYLIHRAASIVPL